MCHFIEFDYCASYGPIRLWKFGKQISTGYERLSSSAVFIFEILLFLVNNRKFMALFHLATKEFFHTSFTNLSHSNHFPPMLISFVIFPFEMLEMHSIIFMVKFGFSINVECSFLNSVWFTLLWHNYYNHI